MIPAGAITAWSASRPWPNRAAIEQDRGGTCLHQVVLSNPRRYSEDLDSVRASHSGIGDLFDALREVADQIGLDVTSTDVGTHPKLRMRASSEDDPAVMLRIKVEINTHETSPARPIIKRLFEATDQKV